MPISFDVPALNIPFAHKAMEVFLTSEEAYILEQSVPNIKVVLINKPEIKTTKPTIEKKPKKELLTEELPVVPAVPESTVVEEPVVNIEPVIEISETILEEGSAIKKSTALSLIECLEYIKQLTTESELNQFLQKDDNRKGVKEAIARRIEELNG